MGRGLKQQWKEFRGREPGERFQISHRRAKETSDPKARTWRLLRILGAIAMVVLGVIFSLIPGIPGFVFFFVAATILAAESLRFARALDATEMKIRGMFSGMRRGRRGHRVARRHS
ncbi:MAG TPA: hypothetical protein VHO24_16560 [Opitutaceae bacterium]|nr:hypothetical protein [Opitutaceae bacterium]